MEQAQAHIFITDLLRLMKSRNGSDLLLSADFPPAMKVDGRLMKLSSHALTEQHTIELARALMNDRQRADFERCKEANFAISPTDLGRYRVNALVQLGKVSMVLRAIPQRVPRLDELGLPEGLREIAMTRHGLVVLVGSTGSGKSTTLAAMVDWRNEYGADHIVTLEDPVEFIHKHKNSLVTQREVGLDTESWDVALKNVLRQAPDVVLMGEIRDREAMEAALTMAETGHLCLATLHANNTNQAIDRIVNIFPHERRQQLLLDLSSHMTAFVSQRLIKRADGKGRVVAVEVLRNNSTIAGLIAQGDTVQVKEVMKRSRERGMQTFDHALFDLFEAGAISYEDAIRYSDSANDLRLQIKLHSLRNQGVTDFGSLDGASVEGLDSDRAHDSRAGRAGRFEAAPLRSGGPLSAITAAPAATPAAATAVAPQGAVKRAFGLLQQI